MGRKSAKIAAKKGATDKAKSQIYTRSLQDVFKASKSGGPDPSTNFLLKVAIERCKKLNVPKDNIERAIKKGQGPDGEGFQDVNYEGYGPDGVAVFVEATTDNPTRTVGNVRSYFKKCNGSVGTPGSLEFLFEQKAIFSIPAEGLDEEEFSMQMIDAGADDVEKDGDFYEITAAKENFGVIQESLQKLNITPDEASLVRLPLNEKRVGQEAQEQIEKLIEILEDDEDIVRVYHNMQPSQQ